MARGTNNAISLSSRFGLLSKVFAGKREHATGELTIRASKQGFLLVGGNRNIRTGAGGFLKKMKAAQTANKKLHWLEPAESAIHHPPESSRWTVAG